MQREHHAQLLKCRAGSCTAVFPFSPYRLIPSLLGLAVHSAFPLPFPLLICSGCNYCPSCYMDFIHGQGVLYNFVIIMQTAALRSEKHLPSQMEERNFLARVKNCYILAIQSAALLNWIMMANTNCKNTCDEVSKPHKHCGTPAWLLDKKRMQEISVLSQTPMRPLFSLIIAIGEKTVSH